MLRNNKGVTHLAILVILFVLATSIATISSVLTYGKGAPSTPTGLSVRDTQGTQVSLSWNLVLGSTDYIMQYQINGAKSWSTFNDGVGTSNSMTVTGLSTDTTYNFRIAASNKSGTSAYSSSVSATTDTTPGTPTSLSITNTATDEISLSWTAPVNNGGASITDYIIQTSLDDSTYTTFSDGTSTNTTTTVTGLNDDTTHYFKVAAVNSVGTSLYTSSITATTNLTATVPDAPTGLTAGTVTDTTVPLSWTAPVNNGGASITDYIIQTSLDGSSWSVFDDGTNIATSTTVTELEKGVQYYLKVAAVNSVGIGVYSNIAISTTFDFDPNFEFDDNYDFSSSTWKFSEGMDFGDAPVFGPGQEFIYTGDIGDNAEFAAGAQFLASMNWGAFADFSAGTSTFSVPQAFGTSTKFAVAQDFSSPIIDHDFDKRDLRFKADTKFKANEILGKEAKLNYGVVDIAPNMEFDKYTIFAEGQTFEDTVLFEEHTHFAALTDFTAEIQTFKKGMTFGAGTTFKSGQIMPIGAVPPFGVVLEAFTCLDENCIPGYDKYLRPGNFLPPGVNIDEIFTSINDENKEISMIGTGVTLSFDTVDTGGTFGIDMYNPLDIPGTTNVSDSGAVTMSTNSGNFTTISTVVDLSKETAEVSGNTSITLTYDEDNLGYLSETDIRMLHYINEEWVVVPGCTLNIENDSVTCDITTFSPFGLGGEDDDDDSSTSGGGGIAAYLLNTIKTPELGFKVYINNGDEVTEDREVKLIFNVDDDITKVAVSNKEDLSDASIQDYTEEMEWDLCSESDCQIKAEECLNGEYPIYVKFYNDYGNVTDIYSSSIFLDVGEVKEADETLVDQLFGYFNNLRNYLLINGTKYWLFSEDFLNERDFTWDDEGNEIIEDSQDDLVEDSQDVIITEVDSKDYAFTRYLYLGTRGQEVRDLQTLLKDKGYFKYSIITGYYGQYTRQAVMDYQKDNNIVPVGMVGPLTRELLNSSN